MEEVGHLDSLRMAPVGDMGVGDYPDNPVAELGPIPLGVSARKRLGSGPLAHMEAEEGHTEVAGYRVHEMDRAAFHTGVGRDRCILAGNLIGAGYPDSCHDVGEESSDWKEYQDYQAGLRGFGIRNWGNVEVFLASPAVAKSSGRRCAGSRRPLP
jgi:hypothetical protein